MGSFHSTQGEEEGPQSSEYDDESIRRAQTFVGIDVCTNKKYFQVKVPSLDVTIKEIKEQIFKTKHWPVEIQTLAFRGATLDNDKVAFDCGYDGVSFDCMDLSFEKTSAQQISILFQDLLTNNFLLMWYLDADEDIGTLKRQTRNLLECSVDELILIDHYGTLVNDDTKPIMTFERTVPAVFEMAIHFYVLKVRRSAVFPSNEPQPFEVEVPHNVQPNQRSAVSVDDKQIEATCPPGVEPGEVFLSELPSSFNDSRDPESSSGKKVGCNIPDAALRGITLGQLKEVAIQIRKRCHKEGWKSTNPKYPDKALLANEVTLYDLNEYFLKPETAETKCSYVETVANSEQKPTWFVSHWWGESVFSFIASLEQHAFDRGLSDDTAYWACAYALNQHEVDEEVGENPKDSPFYRAMRLTEGMVSVLDSGAVSYSRIWCTFEVSIALQDFVEKEDTGIDTENRYLYDIYSFADPGNVIRSVGPLGNMPQKIAVGLTDGVATCDRYERGFSRTLQMDSPVEERQWAGRLEHRQRFFPLHLCEKALNIRLEDANASVEADKKRILNSISGNLEAMDADPPGWHESYDEVNRTLRGKFAAACYRHALNAKRHMNNYRHALSKAPLVRFELSFDKHTRIQLESSPLLNALPTTLESLDLSYYRNSKSRESSDTFFLNGLGRLVKLKSLKLDFTEICLDNDFIERLVEECHPLVCVQQLFLILTDNQDITNIDGFGTLVSCMPELKSLQLEFTELRGVSCVDTFAEGLASLSKLSKLALDFDGFNLSSAGKVGEVIGTLSQLSFLDLSFRECKFTNVKSVARSIDNLVDLRELHLNFVCNPDLEHLDGLGEAIACLKNIQKLDVDFQSCFKLHENDILSFCRLCAQSESPLDQLCLNFFGFPNLYTLQLALRDVKNVKDLRYTMNRDLKI